jgi:hypothetical protein
MNLPCIRRLKSAGALCACALVAGCSEPADEPLQLTVATTPAAPKAVATEQPSVQLASAPAETSVAPTPVNGETPTAADVTEEPPPEEYTPPFPDRVDLFVAPKRQGGGPATVSGTGGSVELNGFVNVDRPRAVLTIDGQMANMAEGETQSGVEVISIQPPKVILQRGRQRWQTTLD